MLRPAFLTRTRYGRRSPLLRALLAWLPEDALFGGAAPGFVYRPRDKGKLKQNPDGTGAVVNPGDPVGFVEDTSGNGNHATQSDPAKKGKWEADGYISFPAGGQLVATFDPIADATTGWAYLDGGEVTATVDLSSGVLIIDDAFYGLVVTEGSLTSEDEANLQTWLDDQVTTPTLQAATGLFALFVPD